MFVDKVRPKDERVNYGYAEVNGKKWREFIFPEIVQAIHADLSQTTYMPRQCRAKNGGLLFLSMDSQTVNIPTNLVF